MEILHSAVGLVRSPLFTTMMQVGSRLVLVWGATAWAPACQNHWSLFLMASSWALVEVPRYTFYAVNLYMKTVPYPLFFLRYSLFMVLYPTGITGEVLQMTESLGYWKEAVPIWYRMLLVILVLYIPGKGL